MYFFHYCLSAWGSACKMYKYNYFLFTGAYLMMLCSSPKCVTCTAVSVLQWERSWSRQPSSQPSRTSRRSDLTVDSAPLTRRQLSAGKKQQLITTHISCILRSSSSSSASAPSLPALRQSYLAPKVTSVSNQHHTCTCHLNYSHILLHISTMPIQLYISRR